MSSVGISTSVIVRLLVNQRALYAYVNDVLTEHKHKHKKKAYAYADVVACSAGVFWRGREREYLIKRAPSWIQTRKRLGGRKMRPREWELGIWRRIYDREL